MEHMENMAHKQEIARKSFNDVLKAKEAREAELQKENDDGHIALDDAKRIKVLSPGQLVFKRFIRNKLAIFGSIVIICMFIFSFLCPLLYPYKETQTFYKYDTQFIPMGQATVRTDYSNMVINPEIKVDSHYQNYVTSTVKKIETNDLDFELIVSKDRSEQFVLTKLGEKLFSLAPNGGAYVASIAGNQEIATYDNISGIKYVAKEMDEGFAEAVKTTIEGMGKTATSATFSYNDDEYEIVKQNKTTYRIKSSGESVVYIDEVLGEAFEDAAIAAKESGAPTCEVDGVTYRVLTEKGVTYVYSVIPGEDAIISTTMEYSGVNAKDTAFLEMLYHNLQTEGGFEYDGEHYTINADTENGVFYSYALIDSEGEEVGLLSDFILHDADGRDSISLANKEVIQDKVLWMIRNNIVDEDTEPGEEGEDAEATEAETAPEDEEFLGGDDEPGSEEQSADNAKGTPVDLIFPEQKAGFDGVNPTLTTTLDENGEVVMGTLPGRIIRKITTNTNGSGETQEYEYYNVSCDQWRYLMDTSSAPSSRHILGTDTDGYDVLARIMYGGRISLLVGFIVVILETVLGVIMGGIAGYFGGWVDNLIMRLVDIFYCIPSMPILIIMGAFMDEQGLDPIPRLIWMMAILGFLGWAGIARLVRGQILSLREQEFMVATEATGVKVSRRIFRHLIPNVMPQLIVSATAGLGGVILTESTLSFLGLGVKRPMATWGTIISGVTSSNENILNFTYIWIPVGILICLTVIAFNFVGDGLRDAFDPKMKR